MSETKRFPLRTVLSVTTGRLLTKSKGPRDNGIGDLYALLSWMTNDEPYTHQLGRFEKECTPWLLRWFPELTAANTQLEKLDEMIEFVGAEKATEAWLEVFSAILPAEYDVPRIPAGEHVPRDPISELIEMRGTSDGIIEVHI